jgi:hypothetical protein
MPSPRKIEKLCCLVNPEGNCFKCKKPKCVTHSFGCIECETVCYDCGVADVCSDCTVTVCRKCLMVTRSGFSVCPYCYESSERKYDDMNYNEDGEWDR